MSTPLQEYQAFIDSLLEWPRVSVKARHVREWGNRHPLSTYQTPEEFDAKMRLFTAEQRQSISDMLQEERDASIHAILNFLNDEIISGCLRLVRNGQELPVEPYGENLYMDWA